MPFPRLPKLLRLSFGLSVSLVLVNTQAHAFVGISEHTSESVSGRVPLIGQQQEEFDPTDSKPLDDKTAIDTTGGRYQYFQPPADGRSLSGPMTTTGSRGICRGVDTARMLAFSGLGPQSTFGRTTRVRPEFVWYVPELQVDATVIFQLFSREQEDPLHRVNFAAGSGFVQYQLPDTLTPLDAGKDYVWQVNLRIPCPGNAPIILTKNLPFQVVTSTPELTEALATATTEAEQAIAYGNAGIWYDAFALVASGDSPDEKEIRTGLLEDLALLEGEDETFSSMLSAIAEQTDIATPPVLSPMSHVAPE